MVCTIVRVNKKINKYTFFKKSTKTIVDMMIVLHHLFNFGSFFFEPTKLVLLLVFMKSTNFLAVNSGTEY